MDADKETKQWLEKQGPYIHVTLYHHHQITAKLNEVEEPTDDTLVTFNWPNGNEYNIKYGKLREYAAIEQKKLIQQNGDNAETME